MLLYTAVCSSNLSTTNPRDPLTRARGAADLMRAGDMTDATDHPPADKDLPPLAFIYDRRTSDTDRSEGVLRLRLGTCRAYADQQGWEQAGEWIDDGDAALSMTRRPQFEMMCGLIRHHAAARTVVCLIADWPRLANDAAPLARFCYQVDQAGGHVVTSSGATEYGGPLTTPATYRL